jgi:uncharacterized protein YfcZ (UPF0381/DUF406 family)
VVSGVDKLRIVRDLRLVRCLLCCVAVAVGVVPDSEDTEASLRDVLAAALEANQELARLAGELREENAQLRAENAEQAAELEKLRAPRA